MPFALRQHSNRSGFTEKILGDLAQMERRYAVFNDSAEKMQRFPLIAGDIVNEIFRFFPSAPRRQKDREHLRPQKCIERDDQAVARWNALFVPGFRLHDGGLRFHFFFSPSLAFSDFIVAHGA